jgi:hypothetical protein
MSRRLTVCVALFGLAAVLVVAQRPDAVSAQVKDKKDATEKQLRAELQQAERAIAALKQQVNTLQATNNKLAAELKKERKEDKADDKTIKGLRETLDGYRQAGLVHVVLLKLKPDSPSSEVQSLIDDTYSQLAKIKTVRGVWAGKPSAKGTPDVAKGDYTVALLFLFDDAAGLRKYLDDPVHVKFVDRHLKRWETPVVYDFEPTKRPAP